MSATSSRAGEGGQSTVLQAVTAFRADVSDFRTESSEKWDQSWVKTDTSNSRPISRRLKQKSEACEAEVVTGVDQRREGANSKSTPGGDTFHIQHQDQLGQMKRRIMESAHVTGVAHKVKQNCDKVV
ncbi:hypothetical protein J6590_003504 [Homalodisca vitripennis]|nr:hypothetical protein J6590_003504 [Homalodisca vitripennis]